MTWTAVYPWLVTVHVLGVFVFLALHGVSMGVWWRVRHERDRAKLAAWLELSSSFMTPMFLAGLLLIVSGIVAGIAGEWWFNGQWWLWVSIAALVVIVALMTPMLAIPLGNVRRGLGIPGPADRRAGTVPTAVDDAELEQLLANRRPTVGALTAIGGIVLITWLMETKPF